MSDDNLHSSSGRPAVQLLDELESIKGALANDNNANAKLPTDIPLLDDMVIQNLNSNAKLLNIDQIFEDDIAAENAPATMEHLDVQFPRFTLDVAITEDNDIDTATSISAPISASQLSTQQLSTQQQATQQPSTQQLSTLQQATQQPSTPQLSAPQRPRVRPDYSREVLIQEIVDEFVPQIEAELQKRLRQLDDAALHELKDSGHP